MRGLRRHRQAGGTRMNEIPRRIRLDHMTPAELAIRAAVEAVEMAGADPLLTEAATLLSRAQSRVADFVDAGKSYRGWAVSFEYGYYWATSPNYDASYEGPEDGWVDNGLRVSA